MIIDWSQQAHLYKAAGAARAATYPATGGLPLLVVAFLMPASWLANVRADSRMPISWIQAFTVLITDHILPVEWRAALRADSRLPVDYARAMVTSLRIRLSWLAGVRAIFRFPIEIIEGLPPTTEVYRSILRAIGLGSEDRPTDYGSKKRPTDYSSER